MYGIFTYIYLKESTIHIGQYTNPMDPMGYRKDRFMYRCIYHYSPPNTLSTSLGWLWDMLAATPVMPPHPTKTQLLLYDTNNFRAGKPAAFCCAKMCFLFFFRDGVFFFSFPAWKLTLEPEAMMVAKRTLLLYGSPFSGEPCCFLLGEGSCFVFWVFILESCWGFYFFLTYQPGPQGRLVGEIGGRIPESIISKSYQRDVPPKKGSFSKGKTRKGSSSNFQPCCGDICRFCGYVLKNEDP